MHDFIRPIASLSSPDDGILNDIPGLKSSGTPFWRRAAWPYSCRLLLSGVYVALVAYPIANKCHSKVAFTQELSVIHITTENLLFLSIGRGARAPHRGSVSTSAGFVLPST